jgi:hypothetical protein
MLGACMTLPAYGLAVNAVRKLANTLLASGGQSDLPSTQEYGIS